MIGSINDEILHTDELAAAIIFFMQKEYPNALPERYQINSCEDVYKTLEEIGISRQCLQKGGQPDILRAASMVIDDFRSGKLGRVTLEHPEEWT